MILSQFASPTPPVAETAGETADMGGRERESERERRVKQTVARETGRRRHKSLTNVRVVTHDSVDQLNGKKTVTDALLLPG